jgi:hypothetical protein
MTNIYRTSLLRFCLSLLIASFSITSFAANKSTASTAKASAKTTTSKAPASKASASKATTSKSTVGKAASVKADKKTASKPVVEDLGPGAIVGKHVKRANLKSETASAEARQMADWVVDSGDNKNMPFVILDKKEAKVYVFHRHGGLRGAAPVLLGITPGDDSFPGVGSKPLSQVKPEEKTTPAGRYLAASDKNIKGADIVWIDYESSVSFHAVVKGKPEERRFERLSSPLPSERRISFGCVNVPVNFFKTALLASFKKSDGMVYVLPETRTVNQVFASYYDVNEKEKVAAASQ